MKHYIRHAVVLTALLAAGIGPDLSVAAPGPQTGIREGQEDTGYALGTDDQITIRVHDAEEFNDRPYRIAANGYVSLPMIGRIKAAGLTVAELESELTSELKKYIRQPEVSVTVAEFRSQPVTVIGAVKSPGILQLQGSRTLVEILSMAGGMQPDAGHSVMIMRKKEWGPLPLPGAQMDPAGEVSTAEVKLEDVLEARGPEFNIVVRPNDIVSVPRAEIIYVLGAVKKSGGFVLNQRDSLSVLQVLSMAEGLERTAAPQKSKILRTNPNTNKREEIPFDLAKVFSGKAPDVSLQPNDILFVPDSAPKKAAFRTLDALVTMGTSVVTGLAIYR